MPRLLQSIEELNAAIYILDSGSTDDTLAIAKVYNAGILTNKFANHPSQWDYALKNFDVKTPWVICLDADQIVTPELKQHLINFRDEDHKDVDGIYFNRKNYFKGRWIKHGGYYPFYLLKMMRFGVGHSDLNENMDHRMVVPGKTIIWKDGHILEENLKENNISFWIEKHNRYSDLVAHEEVERMEQLRQQTVKPHFWGSPDERTAWLKQLWWKMPRYTRPMLYFIYRFVFRLGVLDGRTGVIFHFLQGYWFRLVVDIKIDEIIRSKSHSKASGDDIRSPIRFMVVFIILFLLFYYFNIWFFGVTNEGNHYIPFLANHLNYIQGLRWLLLKGTASILSLFGYTAITNDYDLLVSGHGTIQLVYSCLGLGVISFFAAFVIAFPKKHKVAFLLAGILGIEILNVIRFIVLELFWDKSGKQIIDHHTIFNIIIYIIVAATLYFWIKNAERINPDHAAN